MKSVSPPPFFPTPATPATQATERKDLPRSEVGSINSRCLGNDQRFSPGEDRGSCGNRAYYHGRITAPTQPFFSHHAMFLRSRSWRLKSCGPTEHWVIFYKVWNRIVYDGLIRQALRQTQAICAICIKCKLQLRSQITPLRPVCKSAQLKEIEVSEGREILEQKRWHGHSALSILLIISNFCISTLIIYTKKLFNSDWLRKECNSSVTRVQITNGFWLLKTKKKPPRTNQIWAVLTTKFKKNWPWFSANIDLILYAKQQ